MAFSYVVQSVINGLLTGGIYALLAVGFSLTWGVMKVLNISHPVFALLGAYVAYWLFVRGGIDPLLSLPIVVVFLSIIGVVVYRLVIAPVSRSKDIVMASFVATFGVAIIVQNIMSYLWTVDSRVLKPPYAETAVFIGDITIPGSHLVGFALAVFTIILLYLFLHGTYTGKAVQATWQNRVGAALMGINLNRVTLITFSLALASASIAGVAMALLYSFYPALHMHWLLFVFLVTILGGVGRVIGAACSGLIIGCIIGLVGAFFPYLYVNVILFILLLLFLLIRPAGLFRD